MATMEERRKANRETLFGGAEKRKKRLSDFQKKADAAAKKRKSDKAAKDKKRVESRKAVIKNIEDKNKKRGPMIPKALSKEERRKRLKDRVNKKVTPKKVTPKKVTPKKVTPKVTRATDKGGRSAVPGIMRGKQVNTKMGPNMSKVTKVTAADRKKQKGGADNRSTMQKLFGPSEEKRKMGRNMQKRAQASMGFKKGGKMPDLTGDGKVTRADVLKGRGVFKYGGKVKKMQKGGKCKIDGIAMRGKTRARTK